MVQYANRIQNLVNELSAVCHPVLKLKKKCALRRGLIEEYSIVAQIIRTIDKSFDESMSHLFIHESTLDEAAPSKDHAFLASKRRPSWKQNNNSSRCFQWKQEGHIANDCWHSPEGNNFRRKHTGSRKPGKPYDNPNDDGIAMLVQRKALVTPECRLAKNWMIKSACTRYVCDTKARFKAIVESPRSIQFGNRAALSDLGVVNVDLTTIVNGRKLNFTLNNVLYCPGLIYNLISCSQCRRNKHRTVINDDCANPVKRTNDSNWQENGKDFFGWCGDWWRAVRSSGDNKQIALCYSLLQGWIQCLACEAWACGLRHHS